MSALVDASNALMAWQRFLEAYGTVEPSAVIDLRSDPPPFILDLQRRARDAMPARPR